jgi:predicted HicB family RNase H-like nuclease
MSSNIRAAEVLRVAHRLFSQRPDWVSFFRDVLGLGGIVRQMYPTAHDLTEFEKTAEYSEVQQMLAKLRVDGPPVPEDTEPTRTITIRLPKSLHEFLQVEAHEKCTSMNQLCISKLVQWLDPDLITFKNKTRQEKAKQPQVQPLSLFFDLEDFESSDIVQVLELLSDLYRTIGGDKLEIKATGLAGGIMALEPTGG